MEETELVFRTSFGLWAVFLCAGAFAAVSLLSYRRTTRPVSRRLKALLISLRLGALLLLLACLLSPAARSTTYTFENKPLVFLIDRSRSMSHINDTVEQVSRLAAVSKILHDNSALIESLRKRYDLIMLGFGRDVWSWEREPEAGATRGSAYGRALQDAFESVMGKGCDGIVVFGDGSHNLGRPDPVDVAAMLNEHGVPVYTMGIGQESGSDGLLDVEVSELEVPEVAYRLAAFPVRGQVLFRGCKGRSVELNLDFAGQKTQVESVALAHEEEVVPVEFEVVPEKPGQFKVTLSAEQLGGEVLAENNEKSAFVKVVKGELSVGYFDRPRPESKFIARAMGGAKNVNFRRTLLLSGRRFPGEQTDWESYDAVIIGDLQAKTFGREKLEQLKDAVQTNGLGVVLLVGTESDGLGGFRGTPLEEVLPVTLSASAEVMAGARRLVPESGYEGNAILAMAESTGESVEIWRSLPALSGVVTGPALKRASEVLARDEAGNPLLVVGRSGKGRTGCLFAHTTMRWSFTEQKGQDEHKRFWRQLAMWAAGVGEKKEEELRVTLNKTWFVPEEEAEISIHLLGADGKPVRDSALSLKVTTPSGESRELPPVFSSARGCFTARYSSRHTGDYLVEAAATREGELIGRDGAGFQILDTDIELQQPVANLKLLRRISAATRDSGGRYYFYSNAYRLLEELEERGKPLQLTTEQYRDVWDTPLVVILFVAFVGAEWSLRKWKGLI